MDVIVIGGSGMLGQDLQIALRNAAIEAIAPSHADFDVTDPLSAARLAAGEFGEAKTVINCAAYTAVDSAETNQQAAYEQNALGPGYLGQACAVARLRLIHVSTDFVFDGNTTVPYDEFARTNPLGVYGQTKRAGEEAVLASGATVVRTSWLFGAHGKSFPRTIIRAWLQGRPLKVVADQIGCPTYTGHLAQTLTSLHTDPVPFDILHAVGPEAMSWHGFAVRAVSEYRDFYGLEREVEIEPIKTTDWPTPAKRPAYSVLADTRLHRPMPSLDEALREFAERLGPPDQVVQG